MKIAILSAMQEELDPILKNVDVLEKIDYADNTFYIAKFLSHDLVLAYSKIGKVNAALTATIMIEKFRCEIMLFAGVAGSLKDLKIKDLIVAKDLVQHDLDISAFGHPFGYVPGSKTIINTSKELNLVAKDVARSLDLDIKFGTIATGDQFLNNEQRKDWIVRTFDADAVEMEGCAVGVVCDSLKIPFFVLRCISDNSGGKAEVDFDEFLNYVAAISAQFLLKMVEKL